MAKTFTKKNAEAVVEEKVPVTLKARKEVSKDTRSYTFNLLDSNTALGLQTCQHIQLGFHFTDKMVIRSYTPTRPILENEEDGTFELVVETYFPTDYQPSGAMSNILDCMPIGEEIDIRGPIGDIAYKGMGEFEIEGKEMAFRNVTLILGGSGITPGYQLIVRILKSEGDDTKLRVIDANKSEDDILLREQIIEFKKGHGEQIKTTHVLSHPSDGWKGIKGHVNADILWENAFKAERRERGVFVWTADDDPEGCVAGIEGLGYKEEKNCFGF